jgi:hypothetical protein
MKTLLLLLLAILMIMLMVVQDSKSLCGEITRLSNTPGESQRWEKFKAENASMVEDCREKIIYTEIGRDLVRQK